MMEYHAVIEESQGWWIGWLVDLPGANAQERTKEELLKSLKNAAEDMLDLKNIRDPNVEILVQQATESSTPWKAPKNQVAEDAEETRTKD
jgi:predicted RNase H-like HicB family nuclease